MDAATIGTSDSDQPVVELRYQMRDEDIFALNSRVRYLFNLPGWAAALFWRLFILIGPILAVWIAGADLAGLIAAGVMGLLGFAGLPFLTRYSTRRRTRALYKPSQLDVRLVAEGSNIRLAGGEDSSTISWGSIERGEETKAHFFLFLTRLQALVVPKRAFANESDMSRFRQMISERVKDFVVVG